MPRVPLTEYKAKEIVCGALGLSFNDVAFNIDSDDISLLPSRLDESTRYVAKIDAGIKKRFKQGLVGVDLSPTDVVEWIKTTHEKGYSNFIITPLVPHEQSEERYLSLEQVRTGILLRYSPTGGVDIEDAMNSVQEHILKDGSEQGLPETHLDMPKLIQTFNDLHMSFLEINPLVVKDGTPYLLDIAIEVDSVAAHHTLGSWQPDDTVDNSGKAQHQSEKTIHDLAQNSQASFKFTILNPNGSIFLLLSGGGASITLADEFHNLGLGNEVANYGEYSGNPTTEESYIYTKALLESLLASTAENKKLIIGGGVANFTDVYNTFKGLLQAMNEVKDTLQEHHIKVFVRRGGPNQEKGLAAMKAFLAENDLLGIVAGPEMPLGEIAKLAIQSNVN